MPVDRFLRTVEQALRHPRRARQPDMLTAFGIWSGVAAAASVAANGFDLLPGDFSGMFGGTAGAIGAVAVAAGKVLHDRVDTDASRLSRFYLKASTARSRAVRS